MDLICSRILLKLNFLFNHCTCTALCVENHILHSPFSAKTVYAVTYYNYCRSVGGLEAEVARLATLEQKALDSIPSELFPCIKVAVYEYQNIYSSW